MAAPTEYMEEVMTKAIRLLKNRIRNWKDGITVWWYQEGNTIRVRVRRNGFFKPYNGIPFVCDIEIDPTLINYSLSFNSSAEIVKASEVVW